MMNQPSPEYRTQAELLRDLRYGTPQEQEDALTRLAAVGEAEALDAVIDYMREHPGLAGSQGLETLRVLAYKFMPQDRYGLAEALIPYLSAGDWGQRLISARLMNTHPNELAVDALRSLVNEAIEKLNLDQQSRFSAGRVLIERVLGESIMALANCGRLSVLPEILEMLEDHALRPVAARALGVIGSETERERLEDLIEDEDVRVRDAAQWALGLMDERAEQFMMPPDQIPEPPPDRLSPVYWAHRQLKASDEEWLQFLIVRIAIEHLMLDPFLGEGRVPERCLITVRRYEGDTPPDFRQNKAEFVGLWEYRWHGPLLQKLTTQPSAGLAPAPRPGMFTGRGASITISYPATLPVIEGGLVSFDCIFEPFMGRGWIYQVARGNEGWSFALVRRSWTS